MSAELFDAEEQFENIKKSLSGAIQEALTVEGKTNRLAVRKVEVEDELDPEDLKSQLDAKLSGKTWGVPLFATLELRDKKTDDVLDRTRIRLLDIPKMTPRYSFIVNGSEFQVSNQLRLRPGAYIRKQRTGETEAFVNLERGINFRVHLRPQNNKIVAKIGSANVNVYTLMHVLGVKDKEMQDALGTEVHSSIITPNVDSDILKLNNSLFRESETKVDKALANLRTYFENTKISPETTEATLGMPFDRVTGPFMLRTVKKLINVHRGDQKPDDRDEIRYKKLFTTDDLLEQRISKNVGRIRGRIRNKLDSATEVRQILQPKQIAKLIYAGKGEDAAGSFYNSSALSNNPDQVNPVEFLSGASKVTYFGEGGILDRHAITLPSRNINDTQIGFLDPVHTPENQDIGIVNHLPLGVAKRRGELRTRVEDRKGNIQNLSSSEAYGQVIALPGEFDEKWKPRSSRVSAYSAGEIREVAPGDVTHRFPDHSDLFTISTNLIPFLSANQGTRAVMAAKMMDQAVPLIEREAPLVQAKLKGELTTDEAVGSEFSLHSPVGGKVVSIDDGIIRIKDAAGKAHELQYYKDFPLNGDVALDSTLRVSIGDSVKKGQLLADTNFTSNGVLAMGKNLKVGYLPFRGYSFEDGVVVSESAANKMTSGHMHRVEAPRIRLGGVKTVYDKPKFSAYYPTKFTRDQMEKLDDEGVVAIGKSLKPGDPVIAYLQEKALTPEDVALGKLRRSLVKPYRDKSITWDIEDEGVVTRVSKTPEGPIVWVKTKEPLRMGDKISGRHGNKGIITMVVPDREMPRTKDGEPLDIIMDPHGIPSRINVGQVFETIAGKISAKTGVPFKVDNFTEDSYIDLLDREMKKAKITDREPVFDPISNEQLGTPLVGRQFIMKLKHHVRTKFTGRSTGKYTQDLRPSKGGEESSQSLDPLKMFSMLAHGAKSNIFEMSSFKSQDNPEFWAAIQRKEAIPSPKPTFAWEKFVNLMRASGVNVLKEGDVIRPVPLTDDEILSMSSGEIKDAKYFRAKDLRPERGGLFDPVVTGGVGGGRWSHITLSEPMPNPVFEDAIRSLTGLTEKELGDIISGRMAVTSKGEVKAAAADISGGEAVRRLLSKIDIDAEMKKEEERIGDLKGAELNRANRKIRILRNLKDLDVRPETAFILNNIPVIPPKFRPVYPDESGIIVESPINHLYKNLILVNRSLADSKRLPLKEDRTKAREEMYNALKVFQGWAEPQGARKELMHGIFDLISSKGQPKGGFYQSKLLTKRQDISGRSTIILGPDLHMDQVGIPEEMAWKIFEPFIAQELHSTGYPVIDALKMIQDKDPRAKSALDRVIEKRPVILNRAPSLHKHSVLAFRPMLVKGKSIQLPPLVTKGFNADFDGDQQQAKVYIDISSSSDTIKTEAKRMAARIDCSVPVFNGREVWLIDLEDFPHEDLVRSKNGSKGRIDFYKAPEGIKVLALDETGVLSWRRVSNWSVHHKRTVQIVDLSSGYQIATDDDPRAVFGIDRHVLELKRFTPEKALANDVLVPRCTKLPEHGTENVPALEIDATPRRKTARLNKVKSAVRADEDVAYFLGAFIGDGWVSGQIDGARQVNICGNDEDVLREFERGLAKCMASGICPPATKHRFTRERNPNRHGDVKRRVYSIVQLARFLHHTLGHGARNKHLPPWFLNAKRSIREALFGGLMDTDGSICMAKAKGKNAPQLMASFSTINGRLAREVALLARSLGIRARITPFTYRGNIGWTIQLSTTDIHQWKGKGMRCQRKLAVFDRIPRDAKPENAASAAKADIVPFPDDIAEEIGILSQSWHQNDSSLYVITRKAISTGRISRNAAKRILARIPDKSSLLKRYEEIVRSEGITWDRVIGVQKTRKRETGYDLTVPGAETFMDVDGIVLSNTMSVEVPVTREAVEEAMEMLPSRNVLSTSGRILTAPSQASQLGLFLATQRGKKTNKKYENDSEAIAAHKQGEIDTTDIIDVSGTQTTVGKMIVNKILPKNARNPDIVMDKKTTQTILEDMARNNPQEVAAVADKLKDVGFRAAYEDGFSVGLDDFRVNEKERDAVISKVERKIQSVRKSTVSEKEKEEQIAQALVEGQKELADRLKRTTPESNSLARMVASGSRGSWDQVQQMIAAPVAVEDATGRIIPSLISTSYAEGLTPAEYWNAMHGARKGLIEKTVRTSEPGAMNKALVHTTINYPIYEEDCGTDQGLQMASDDKEIVDRYLSDDAGRVGKKGDLVTPELANRIAKAGIKKVVVRSPVSCASAKGVCQACAGMDEYGKPYPVGANIGTISAQAVTEPATQLTLRTFHTGGVISGEDRIVDSFRRVRSLMEFPEEFPEKATLAETSGKVRSIVEAPIGGWNVTIEDKVHYIPPDRKVRVKPNETVDKGTKISTGGRDPKDVLRILGMTQMRTALVEDLADVYRKAGPYVKQKHFETVVRAITDSARIRDPRDSDYVSGDIVPYNQVKAENAKNVKDVPVDEALGAWLAEEIPGIMPETILSEGDVESLKRQGIKSVKANPEPIDFEPVLKGIRTLPLTRRDWLAQMAFTHLKDAIRQGVPEGWKSPLHETNPIPGVIYGAEFGMGKFAEEADGDPEAMLGRHLSDARAVL